MEEQLKTKKKVDKRTSRKRPHKMIKAEQYKKINKQGLLGSATFDTLSHTPRLGFQPTLD